MNNDAFSGRLSEGERVLWSGRPGKGLMLARADVFITLVLLWMGFSYVCDRMAASSGTSLLAWMWNMIGVLYGLFLIASPLLLYACAFQGSFYAVTSSRILLLRGRTHGGLVALPLDRLSGLSLTKGRRGRGTIFFGPDARKPINKAFFFPNSSFRMYFDPRHKFFAIDDAQEVFAMIQRMSHPA